MTRLRHRAGSRLAQTPLSALPLLRRATLPAIGALDTLTMQRTRKGCRLEPVAPLA